MPTEGELLADRYRIESLVSRGAAGPVFLCHDLAMDRDVLLRVLAAERRNATPEQWQRDLRHLETEARAAGRVAHQNLVTAYSLESDPQGNRFLVLSHGAEPTLRDVLNGGPLGISRALEIALDLARAVQALDGQGIVHRDIKPENILIDTHGSARLTGLGVAQLRDDTLLTDDSPGHPGTPAYMSPEQATTNASLDQRSDLYALGLILYEMLTASRFTRDRFPLSYAMRGTPSALIAIVQRLLEPEPDARYASADAVIVALEHVRDQGVPGQLGLVLGRMRARTVLAAAGILAVLVLANSVYALGRRIDAALTVSASAPVTATLSYSERDALLAVARGEGRSLALVSTAPLEGAAAPATGALSDAYEPDESVPATISPWETQHRAFDVMGDVDRMVFLVKAGQGYLVTTSNLAIGVDTQLEVLVDGGVLANDDVAPGTLASQVAFTARADGTAQVTVRNQDQYGSDKAYDVSVLLVEAPAVATLPAANATQPAAYATLTPIPGQLFVPGVPATGLAQPTVALRATWTPRATVTLGPTRTPLSSVTPQATVTRRPTWTRVPTWTPRPTLSGTVTPTPTRTPTGTLTVTPTPTETQTPTATQAPPPTATPPPTTAPTNLPTLAHTSLPPPPTGPPGE
ncbi:MAG: serine/threonine-protein kinase [Anaerolineae bacterium]